jgi:hypothetical protein
MKICNNLLWVFIGLMCSLYGLVGIFKKEFSFTEVSAFYGIISSLIFAVHWIFRKKQRDKEFEWILDKKIKEHEINIGGRPYFKRKIK